MGWTDAVDAAYSANAWIYQQIQRISTATHADLVSRVSKFIASAHLSFAGALSCSIDDL
jgi:hypothetical protein